MTATRTSEEISGQTMKSWIPRKKQKLEQMTITSMVHTLSQTHLRTAESVVPWYLSSLPAAYFREVDEETRNEHLKGLTALKGINQQDISLTLRSKTNTGDADVTVMSSSARPGILLEMLESMPVAQPAQTDGGALCRVRVFSSFDGDLALNIFTYGNRGQERPRATARDGAAILNVVEPALRPAFENFMLLCEPAYVQHAHAECFGTQRELYEAVKGTDGTEATLAVHTRSSGEVDAAWVMLAAANVLSRTMLVKVAALLLARGLNVEQMYLDLVQDPANAIGESTGSVAMIRALVKPIKGEVLPSGLHAFEGSLDDLQTESWNVLLSDLRRIKWLDSNVVNLALKEAPTYGMQRAEILTAFCAMLHGPLNKINPYMFSRPSLLNLLRKTQNIRYFVDIANLFIARFNPQDKLSDTDFKQRLHGLQERIQAFQEEASRTLMLRMVDVVAQTRRTNLFCPHRYALALRVDPVLMMGPEKEQVPFGVLFVHGDHFDGFHNRFQNIARGGLRIVTPGSAEQHAIESSRCYDEVYGLSFAQQLKNKDIPEGGAKAVVLVDTSRVAQPVRHMAMRQAVKGFTDAVLDLIVPAQETRKWIVDHLGFEELLYLGPDEQVISDDINWIIRRAGQRGYPIPAAFMSSKPAAGINHKQYGVTSEGVVVFLDVALRNLGIDPTRQPFTVKITGGPDGDVAGNLMRILFRNYGQNARVVGVADGSGCAEDPEGLPQCELLRLFEKALPIAELDASKLSAAGAVHRVEDEDGMRKRNSMHNRIQADVFVPAGGRPNTVHAGNWQDFLIPGTTKPSSPLIVEGANIFITPEARAQLHEQAGVRIVKDSSANKCGVITSSYEICASMLLDEDEFLEIKDALVRDVLEKLRELARLEAELMFREASNYPGALPKFSERISKAINRTTVAIEASLSGMERGDEVYTNLMPLFLDHLPRKLTEVAAGRVHSRIPLDYLRNAFASCLASRLLYREGINFLELQPEAKLAEIAIKYFSEEKRLNRLLAAVEDKTCLGEADRMEVIRLLRVGGVRSSLHVY